MLNGLRVSHSAKQGVDVHFLSSFELQRGRMYGMRRYYAEILRHLPNLKYAVHIIHTRGEEKLTRDLEFIYNNYFYSLLQAGRIKQKTNNGITLIASQHLSNILNFWSFQPSILVCFDLIELTKFGAYQSWLTRRLKLQCLAGMRRANRVITISNFSKQEISNYFDIDLNRIDVAHPAVNHDRFYTIEDFNRKKYLYIYGLPMDSKIVLYVGSEQPRKNLGMLVNALARVIVEIPNLVFVKAGNPEWRGAREALLVSLKNSGLETKTKIIEPFNDEDLRVLYNLADVFIFPSFYEGFGLPPLEAMACGCPVVSSNATSLPEVVANAAVTVSPNDTAGFAAAIFEILTNEKTKRSLVQKGLEQAHRFTWENSAQKFLSSIERVLG